VATVFSFSPMTIFVNSDLVVTHVAADGVETVLTEGTASNQYSVNAPTLPGTGSITYPAGVGVPLPTGESLVMRTILDLDQEQDYENQGGYFPDLQERVVDRLTKIDRQQQEELDRSLKVPIGQIGTVSPELPIPLANAALAWNSAGTGLDNGTGVVTVTEVRDAVLAAIPITSGTWTPGIEFGGASVGLTYVASPGGAYTQILDLIFIVGHVALLTKGTSTGSATLTGIPFQASHSTYQNGAIQIAYASDFAGLTSVPALRASSSGMYLTFKDWGAAGNTTDLDDTNFTDNTNLYFVGWYRGVIT